MVAERNSTAALSGQECYDDGKALLEKLQKDTWKAEIDELKKEFSAVLPRTSISSTLKANSKRQERMPESAEPGLFPRTISESRI